MYCTNILTMDNNDYKEDCSPFCTNVYIDQDKGIDYKRTALLFVF